MPRPSAKTSRRRARSATGRRSRSRARPSGSRRSSATRSSRTARSRCSTTRGMRTAGSGWIAGAITASGCRSIRNYCSARTRGWGAIRGGRLRVPYVPLDRRAAALVRLVARHVREWTPPDELWVEETLLEILGRLAPSAEPRRTGATPRHDRVVRSVRELLSSRPEQPWTVTSIAKVVGVSAFHACRVFRRRTGYTLHGYLTEQRLRRGLGRSSKKGRRTCARSQRRSGSRATASSRRISGPRSE